MTPILQNITPLLQHHARQQITAWLEGEQAISGTVDDEIIEWISRQGIEWDGLLTEDQDALRDSYIEAVKAEAAKRLSLPVSVAPVASLTCVDGEGHPQEYNPPTTEVYEWFKVWWEFYSPDPDYGYSADSKEDHMRQAFWAGYCEAHNRTQTPTAASGVIPQASVAEVAKSAETRKPYICPKCGDCRTSYRSGEGWKCRCGHRWDCPEGLAPPNEDKELLTPELREHLKKSSCCPNASDADLLAQMGLGFTGLASTTSQKGGAVHHE